MATAVKNAVSKATGKVKTTIRVPLEFGTEHGHQIFVYHNIRTHQIIYSLTRSMRNKKALSQIPFLGKKSVPPALRKDHWSPLCVLSFPNPYQGLHAYTRLLEFKHLHEVAWDPKSPTMTVQSGPGAGIHLLPRLQRGRVLMNQKTNSIADMAAVLAIQARAPLPEQVKRARFFVRTDGRPLAKRGIGSRKSHNLFEFQGRIEGTSVWWADLLDAEYAETWPVDVVHGRLAVARGTAVWPPPEELVTREVEVEGGGKESETEEWERERREEKMEERRRLLRRSQEVDVREKIRLAEEMAAAAEKKRMEEGLQGEAGKNSWFESTRRLFPAFAGKKVEGTAATVSA